MISLVIWGVLFALGVGLSLRFLMKTHWVRTKLRESDFPENTGLISWREFIIGSLVCSLLIVPLVVFVGYNMAKSNRLRFDEFWNGYEVKAQDVTIPCERDGRCIREYDCDPYNHIHMSTYTDANGVSHTTYDNHTHYHSCPYATEEHAYLVDTTLGTFTIADGVLTDPPRAWRGDEGIPASLPRGIPPFWQAAYDRIKAKDPGPVTVVKGYDNYILASQSSILKKYSSAIERYREILPAPAGSKGVHSYYYADKAYGVGVKVSDWQFPVMQLNAALGTDLQGDLHLVVVKDSLVKNPDEFTGALNAHWTGKEFGRKALSKNAIVVVIGTDRKSITWSRAFTGMPLGNESMLLELSNKLKGVAFDPATVVGHPVGVPKAGGDYKVQLGSGIIERVLWGEHKFKRVCMTCKEEGGAGFNYLRSEIEPNAGQRRMIFTIAILLSIIIWLIFIFTKIGERNLVLE